MNNPIPFILVCLFALCLPLGLVIYWKKTHQTKIFVFIVGAITFMVFALGLEQIAHYFCLINVNPISNFITNNIIAYALYTGLAAGIFEETGRLFAFKVILKNDKHKDTSVAYGIGHGGIEIIMLLFTTYLIYSLTLMGVEMVDSETTKQIMDTALSIEPSIMLVACLERISALLLHIGLSIFVFYGVRRKKLGYYFLAILLHATADIPAVFYQIGLFPLWLIEAFSLGMGILIVFVARKLYRVLN